MSSPTSLRDLYTRPSSTWSFVPSPPSGNSTSASGFPADQSISYQWSRPSSNPLLSLSLSQDETSGVDFQVALQGLLASALLQYATTALSIPWDVGKTLLQVQWVPRDAEEIQAAEIPSAGDDEDESSEASNEQEDGSYFADPSSSEPSSGPRRLSDDRGYIIRQSVLEESTKPEYVIPVGSADGSWGMMKRLGRFKPEGWLALWKGLFTSALTEAIAAGVQPTVYSLLEATLSPFLPGSAMSPSYTPPSIVLPVASQVLTGFLLSPLDLVRTRLIVQSSIPRYRSYSGPLDALRKIFVEEGGFSGVYLHPHLFLPTILDCTLRSLVPFILPRLFASYLSFGGAPITPASRPFMWGVSELLGNCAGQLIILPFETVRRRLQVQARGTAKPIKACVELRPAPYNGIVDALWHIVTEERSDLPLKPRRKRRQSVHGKSKASDAQLVEENQSWLRDTGIGQLYRGLGLRVGASAIVFLLSILSGDEPDGGWAEL